MDENYITNKRREELIAFAKFAKSYCSSRKVEKAYKQWLVINKIRENIN